MSILHNTSNNPFTYTMVHAPGSAPAWGSGGYGTPMLQSGNPNSNVQLEPWSVHPIANGQGGSPLGNLYRGLQPSTLGNIGQIQRRFGLMGWTPGQNNPWTPQQQPWQLPQGQQNPIHAIGPEVTKRFSGGSMYQDSQGRPTSSPWGQWLQQRDKTVPLNTNDFFDWEKKQGGFKYTGPPPRLM